MRIQLATGTTAELVRCEGEPKAGVVLFPDIMGLRPLFDAMCERLAVQNQWVVCAPEPFSGRENLDVAERLAVMRDLREEDLRADALAAADATGCETVMATGFCMGGMLTFKAAASGRFSRAAAFYGMIRLPADWSGGTLAEPIDDIANAQCPVMAIIGTDDTFTPPADVEAAEKLGVQIVRYQGAEHGFVHDPARPAHRAEDAADAWEKVLLFLQS